MASQGYQALMTRIYKHDLIWEKRIIADVIQLRIVKCQDHPGLSECAGDAITNVPIKDKQEKLIPTPWRGGDSVTRERLRVEWGGWKPRPPRAIRSWERQGSFSPRAVRGSRVLPTPWFWISSLQNWQSINICYLSHPVHGHVTVSWEALVYLFRFIQIEPQKLKFHFIHAPLFNNISCPPKTDCHIW